MKKYFVTGLVILLPLALTLMIVAFILNFLTEPFLGIVKGIFIQLNLFHRGFLFFSAEQTQIFFSKLIILVFLFFFTILLGIFTRWVFMHYVLRFSDLILHRIPIVNTIYKTSQDVIKTIFTTDTRSFKQVVLIYFPSRESRCLGLITQDDLSSLGLPDYIGVFVPTTPNPTSGYLLMVKKSDVEYLDIKIEDALKYIISCGVILNPSDKKEVTQEL